MDKSIAAKLALTLTAILIATAVVNAKVFVVTIHNPNSYALNNYQVRINLTRYLKGRTYLVVLDSKGNLLRFTYEIGNLVFSRNNSSGVIWVKVPEIPANGNVTIYIAPIDVNLASSPDDVFIFYDSFNDLSKWRFFDSLNYRISRRIAHSKGGALYKVSGCHYDGLSDIAWAPLGRYYNFSDGYCLEGWVYRVVITCCPCDQIKLEDSRFEGYGYAWCHSSNGCDIDKQAPFPNWIGINGSRVKRNVLGDWYRFQFITLPNSTFVLNIYDKNGTLLAHAIARDKTYKRFDRIVIEGGNPYLIDDIVLRRYAEKQPVVTVKAVSNVKLVKELKYKVYADRLTDLMLEYVYKLKRVYERDLKSFRDYVMETLIVTGASREILLNITSCPIRISSNGINDFLERYGKPIVISFETDDFWYDYLSTKALNYLKGRNTALKLTAKDISTIGELGGDLAKICQVLSAIDVISDLKSLYSFWVSTHSIPNRDLARSVADIVTYQYFKTTLINAMPWHNDIKGFNLTSWRIVYDKDRLRVDCREFVENILKNIKYNSVDKKANLLRKFLKFAINRLNNDITYYPLYNPERYGGGTPPIEWLYPYLNSMKAAIQFRNNLIMACLVAKTMTDIALNFIPWSKVLKEASLIFIKDLASGLYNGIINNMQLQKSEKKFENALTVASIVNAERCVKNRFESYTNYTLYGVFKTFEMYNDLRLWKSLDSELTGLKVVHVSKWLNNSSIYPNIVANYVCIGANYSPRYVFDPGYYTVGSDNVFSYIFLTHVLTRPHLAYVTVLGGLMRGRIYIVPDVKPQVTVISNLTLPVSLISIDVPVLVNVSNPYPVEVTASAILTPSMAKPETITLNRISIPPYSTATLSVISSGTSGTSIIANIEGAIHKIWNIINIGINNLLYGMNVTIFVNNALVKILHMYIKCPFGIYIRLHSGVNLHIYDIYGRHMGINYTTGKIDDQIPNSILIIRNGTISEVLLMEPRGTYRVYLVGVNRSMFHLEVMKVVNSSIVNRTVIVGNATKGKTYEITLTASPVNTTYRVSKPKVSPDFCVEVSTHVGNVTIISNVGKIVDLKALNISEVPRRGMRRLTYPFGFFSFKVVGIKPGQKVTLTIALPSDLPRNSEYWAVGKNGWQRVPMGSNNGDNVITVTLRDGGVGDEDGVANGVIVHIGGPGVDNVPPILKPSPRNGTVLNSTKVSVSLTSDENLSSAKLYVEVWNGKGWNLTCVNMTGNGRNWSAEVPVGMDTVVKYWVNGSDVYGNENSTKPVCVVIAGYPPVIESLRFPKVVKQGGKAVAVFKVYEKAPGVYKVFRNGKLIAYGRYECLKPVEFGIYTGRPGRYRYVVWVNDSFNNTNETAFTVYVKPVRRVSPPPAGGGGAVIPPPPFRAKPSYYYMTAKLAYANARTVFKLPRHARDVTNVISITAKISTEMELCMAVSKIKKLPSNVPKLKNVYEYFEVVFTKFGTTSRVEPSGTVVFRVPKAWIKRSGYDPNSVALMKFVNGRWIKLKTEKIGEDSKWYYYRAEVPSFSIFAITAKPKVKPKVTVKPVKTPTVTPTKVTTPTVTPRITATVKPKMRAKKPLYIVLVVFAGLAVAVGIAYALKRRR